MKPTLALAAFVGLVASAALPAHQLQERQALFAENDVVNKVPCRPVTLFYVRGTFEPGNIGLIVGPPFIDAVTKKIPRTSIAIQGIEYPGTTDGFFSGGDVAGGQLLARLVGQIAGECPQTKIVASGYSQGAQLVYNAAITLSAGVSARISAAVLFGDPNFAKRKPLGQVPASRVKSICNDGDNICEGGSNILPAHLTYGFNVAGAANFVKQQVGL